MAARPWRPTPASLLSPLRQPRAIPRLPTSRRLISGNRPPRTVADFLRAEPGGATGPLEDAVVHGYVRSVRKLKTDQFVNIGDGSCVKHLQAIVPRAIGNDLRVGAAVRLRGAWVPSEKHEQHQSYELKVREVEVLGPSDPGNYPLQNKYQTLEFLRTLPHLRSRLPLNSALIRLRSDAISAISAFFSARGFTQTHPPIITSSDCEGAGEVFALSSGKPKDPAQANKSTITTSSFTSPPSTSPSTFSSSTTTTDGTTITLSKNTARPNPKEDTFFRSNKYLTVSTQLHLEALAQSVGDVWTLSPTFRAEKSDTSRHMAEFYMLEAEMSFVADMDPVMDLAEDMIRHLVSTLSSSSAAARDILNAAGRVKTADDGSSESLIGPAEELKSRWRGLGEEAPRWPRITYTEAIEMLREAEASGRASFEHRPVWGAGLQAEHEKFLASAVAEERTPGFRTPVFVTRYPRDIKAFYMLESDPSDFTASNSTTTGTTTGEKGEAPSADTATSRPHRGAPEQASHTTTAQTPGPTVDCFDLLLPDVCEVAGGSMREHRLAPLLAAMARHGLPPPSAKPGRSTANLDWYVDLRRWGSPPHGGFGIGFDRLLVYLVGAQNVKDVVAFPRWFGRCDC